jgi:hypothetical protein
MLKRAKTGSKTSPVLTSEQVQAIQPYLKKLLKRYQQVANTGASDLPDPICATLHVGKKDLSCVDCPVWGVREALGRHGYNGDEENWEFVHCENYYPRRPEIVTDDRVGISYPVGGSKEADNILTAQGWGWEVVMWLESLQR